MTKTFVLNQKIFSRLHSQGLPLRCVKCKKRLHPGDVVISKQSSTTRHYHSECYSSMFIEVKA